MHTISDKLWCSLTLWHCHIFSHSSYKQSFYNFTHTYALNNVTDLVHIWNFAQCANIDLVKFQIRMFLILKQQEQCAEQGSNCVQHINTSETSWIFCSLWCLNNFSHEYFFSLNEITFWKPHRLELFTCTERVDTQQYLSYNWNNSGGH